MVRGAALADAKGIATVQVAAWHAAYRGLMPDELLAAFTIEVRVPAWQRILKNPAAGTRTTVFERDQHIVGFATVGPSRDDPKTTDESGEVWAVYAAPDAWGSGVGSALLTDGLEFLAQRGFRRSSLWVLEGNARAISFYEQKGFRLDGVRDVREGLTHLQMTRALSPRR